jgi:hypothetical protein
MGRQIVSRLVISMFVRTGKVCAALLESLPTGANDDPVSGESAQDPRAGRRGMIIQSQTSNPSIK